MSILSISALLGGIAGCASTGTEPHAMTAGEHQAAASAESQAANQHQAKFDSNATERPRAPSPGAYAACVSYLNSNCYVRWRSEENPTEQHRKEAEYRRKLAAEHRAASKVLVDAEQRFCSGISDADRDMSPFAHREDITAVDIVKRQPSYAYDQSRGGTPVGARVVFRAVPGMTAEWLQRVVDCHLARNAVVGEDPSTSVCPLAVAHATAVVSSTGTGFAVDVTAQDDEQSAREIIRRAQALAPGGPTAAR